MCAPLKGLQYVALGQRRPLMHRHVLFEEERDGAGYER